MIPLNREWTPFKDHQDALDHYRRWGLISPTATELRTIMFVDGAFDPPVPCRVVGYETGFENWAVVEVDGTICGIHGNYLADLQPDAHQPLPRGVVFADILAHYVILDISDSDPYIISAATYRYGQRETVFTSASDSPGFDDRLRGVIEHLPIFYHSPSCNFCKDLLRSIGISNATLDISLMVQRVYPGLSGSSLPYLCSALGMEYDVNAVNSANMLLWACLTFRKHEMAWRVTCMNERVKQSNPLPVSVAAPRRETLRTTSAPVVNASVSLPSEYVVLDIETTGFDRYNDRIIEIAAIKFRNGEKVDEFCSLVNPFCTLRPKITKLTGILQMEVDAAPSLEEIKPSFFAFIGDFPLIGHNIKSFDAKFIEAQMGCAFKKDRLIDTLSLAKKAFPGMPQYKLEFLNEELDLGSTTSHRAMADVEATARLYQLCTNQNASAEEPSPKERETYDLLLPALQGVLADNNAPISGLKLKGGESYASVQYLKYDPTDDKNFTAALAFRICYRGNSCYFGISDSFSDLIPEYLCELITLDDAKVGFTNFAFSLEPDCIAKYIPFLSSVLDAAIDKLPKDFDCCSHFEECSNAKHCIHPKPPMAIGCGYRKVLKSGRIFYGPNRNID